MENLVARNRRHDGRPNKRRRMQVQTETGKPKNSEVQNTIGQEAEVCNLSYCHVQARTDARCTVEHFCYTGVLRFYDPSRRRQCWNLRTAMMMSLLLMTTMAASFQFPDATGRTASSYPSISASASSMSGSILFAPPPMWHLELLQEEPTFSSVTATATTTGARKREAQTLADHPCISTVTTVEDRRHLSSSSRPKLQLPRLDFSGRRESEDLRGSNKRNAVYERRKKDWIAKYTTVEGLRNTFGTNHNKVWGDLDPNTSRRLYKTLLPRALLELYKFGVQPQDLAPLAFAARVAAKLYARERCRVPARVFANLFDGFRQWKRYGSFQTAGMSYQQVWAKYSAVVLEECQGEEGLTAEDVTAKICLKILERSCETNEMIDKLVLSEPSDEDQQDLKDITDKLERDVRDLVRPVRANAKRLRRREQETAGAEDAQNNDEPKGQQQLTKQQFRTLRTLVRIKRRLDRRARNQRAAALFADNTVVPAAVLRNKDTTRAAASSEGKKGVLPERQMQDRRPKWIHRKHHRRQ